MFPVRMGSNRFDFMLAKAGCLQGPTVSLAGEPKDALFRADVNLLCHVKCLRYHQKEE
jgi:hypothetical protein